MFFLLSFNVVLNSVAGYSANCFSEITVQPKVVTPQKTLQPNPTIASNDATRNALEITRQLWRGIVFAARNEQVPVIWTELACSEFDFQTLGYGERFALANFFNYIAREYIAPVRGSKLEVKVPVTKGMGSR
jgi:hypothetical protein